MQDMWHQGSDTWFDRTADLRVLLNGGSGGPARLVANNLRKYRELLEPRCLVEAEHQIEVLQRLSGRALHQIVDR